MVIKKCTSFKIVNYEFKSFYRLLLNKDIMSSHRKIYNKDNM